MKVELMAAAMALCFASAPAVAQQSMTPGHNAGMSTSMSGTSLVRPCTSLRATGDCALGLPNRSLGGTGLMTTPNSMMPQNGSGLGSTFLPSSSASPLGANGTGDTLSSRGISSGTIGSRNLAAGPLGVDEDSLMRNGLGGGSLHGGSLGGRSLGGGGSLR